MDGGTALEKPTEPEAPSSEKPKKKKKKAKKDKAAVNGDATEAAVRPEEALKTTTVEPKEASTKAAKDPKPKKTKAVPNSQDSFNVTEKSEASPGPKKKGPSTINVHAEKIKKLLSQKDVVSKPKQKVKKSGSTIPTALTADGVNGVSSNPVDGLLETEAKDKASMSMQAEAQQTTEREFEDDYNSDGDLDQAGALLEGFDSDTEDPAQDEGFEKDKPTAALPNYKKTQKKLRQAAQKGNKEGPGAVYVGRVPHGFYENEMRQYFSQFGTITKLRLSRNRKTGQSKHFAFLEFESTEVAKIVAETMDNYLMFGHILKCKYIQPGSLHPETFKGANKRFRVAPHNKMEKRALEAPKTESQWKKKNEKEQVKREKKAENLKAMGYEIELPKLKNPKEALQMKELQGASEEQVPDTSKTDENEVPAPSAVPKDEVALSKKKSKKEKKEKTASVETIESLVESAASKDKPSEAVQSQDSHESGPEKQGKRKEKREKAKSEKAKNETNQPAAQSMTDETPVKDKEVVNGELAIVEAAPTGVARSSKLKNRKNKDGTAQPMTDETPSTSATAKPQIAAAEEAAPSSTVPVSTLDNDKSKKTSRKRKNPGPNDEVAESTPKPTELTTAPEKEQAVNGKPRAKGTSKKAKKA
jgi:nucleolar protein 15